MLLDHEGRDLTNVLSSIVEELASIGYLNDDSASELLRVLLFRHKYVDSKGFKLSGLPRNQSFASMTVIHLRRYIVDITAVHLLFSGCW